MAKRFQVYFKVKAIVASIKSAHFIHYPLPIISAYLLENRANLDPGLKQSVEQMFRELYIVPEAMEASKLANWGSGNGS